VNRAGVLLDTGPLVSLLSHDDTNHEKVTRLFSACEPPFRCTEAVLAEACFLMRKVHFDGPAEVIALGRKGVYEIPLVVNEHLSNLETLLKKYKNRPISLADACLIRCAEVFEEPRILTFDSDFRIYRWGRNKSFQLVE
jgi:predicted nucleic acid-binding protein